MVIPNTRKVVITKSTRTKVESQPKYSAIPPHTPEIILSLVERLNRALIVELIYNFMVLMQSYGGFLQMFQLNVKRSAKIINWK